MPTIIQATLDMATFVKVPNSMQLAQSKVIEAEYAKIQENQTSRDNITENVKIPRDLDQWTDDQFRIGCTQG